MMVGLFEPVAAAWKVDGIPRDFSFGTIPPDWDRMGPFVERAMARGSRSSRRSASAPSSAVPSPSPPTSRRRSVRRPASTATSSAPGSTRWASCRPVAWAGSSPSGSSTVAPTSTSPGFDVARFRDWQLHPRHRAERTAEILGTVYAAHTPGVELASARGEFRSPVHDRLVAEGARLRDVSGWESADWYAGRGRTPTAEPGLGAPAVVRAVGDRAPGRARGRGAHGHVVHGEVRRARTGCRCRARPAQRGCGQPARRRHHLHPVARRRAAASAPTSP